MGKKKEKYCEQCRIELKATDYYNRFKSIKQMDREEINAFKERFNYKLNRKILNNRAERLRKKEGI